MELKQNPSYNIQSPSVADWNVKIILDDVCDDTLENDEAVTKVMDFCKYSAFNLHSWQVNTHRVRGEAVIGYRYLLGQL